MATTRSAKTSWKGSLAEGGGTVSLQSSGLGTYDVSWPARIEQPGGKTSPEELIAAAHSSCFSMALSGALGRAGNPPQSLETTAEVDFEAGKGITGIRLTVTGSVEGMSQEDFAAAAEGAKQSCPVSQALAGVPSMTVEASLTS